MIEIYKKTVFKYTSKNQNQNQLINSFIQNMSVLYLKIALNCNNHLSKNLYKKANLCRVVG